MPARPGSKNWKDIKMLTAALAAATTLGLWNLFATVDQLNTTQEVASLQTPPRTVVENPAPLSLRGKILLGGQAPSQTIVVQRTQSKHSQSVQQPAPVTQTRSS